MENHFFLSKDNPIFLYGDNFNSRMIYKNLCKNNYMVKAIIDRKYSVIKKENDIEYLSLELLKNTQFSKDSIVIVCMASGLTHESVINGLVNKGFENIIYLPMLINRPLFEQETIRRAYLAVISGSFETISKIPKTHILSECESIVIYKNEIETAFLCPVSMLHTASEKIFKEEFIPLDWEISKKYVDIPLAEYEPFKNLFFYLMGVGNYPTEYLSWERKTEEERKKLLGERKRLFSVFELNYEYNFSFFLYSPSWAIWNEKGYLNIRDGHHRSTYLICKGKKLIPVVVRNLDFEKIMKSKIFCKEMGNATLL